MKRTKILFSILMILLLLCSLFSCKKKNEEVEYYSSRAARQAPTSSARIDLGEYDFAEFLEHGMIEISQGSGEDIRYGMMNAAGKVILPTYYHTITSSGEFFLAEGGEEDVRFYLIDLTGKVIYSSDNSFKIADVGDGYVSIKEGDYTLLYHRRGELILSGLDNSYEYLPCGKYILVRSTARKAAFVFLAQTGDKLQNFLGSDTVTYDVNYVGGDDFIVIKNESVSPSDKYTYCKRTSTGSTYILQTVYKQTIGSSVKHSLSTDKPISAVLGKYAFGMTQEDRDALCLKEGYYAVRYFVTQDKITDGTLAYYLADDSLQELAILLEGINPNLTMIDGVSAVSTSEGAIYLLDTYLRVVRKIDDTTYQAVAYTGDVVRASKVVNGVRKIGGFDKTGKEVVPFAYNYLSDFVGGKAVGVKQGKAYLIDTAGGETYLAEEDFPYLWDGFYEKTADGAVGLTSFNGTELLPCRFAALIGERRYDSDVFVALRTSEGKTEVYRLS